METKEDDDNKISYQGWGVFYAWDSSVKTVVGEKFFANQEYNEQKKWTEDTVGGEDKFGSFNIPT